MQHRWTVIIGIERDGSDHFVHSMCKTHTHTHTHAALFRPQNNKLMLLNSKDLADL